MEEMRRVEVRRGDTWVPIQMKALVVGDMFQLFEEDGTPVIDPNGRDRWTVQQPPKEVVNENGVTTWSVYVEDHDA